MMNLGFGRKRHGFAPGFVPPPGNVITNWAGNGTAGTSGLPDNWKFAAPSGVTLSVLSRTPYRGGSIIEIRVIGTPTVSSACALYLGATYTGGQSAAAAAPGQVWTAAVFAEAVGSQTPGPFDMRMRYKDIANVTLSPDIITALSGTIVGGAANSANVTAPANADSVGILLYKPTVTAGTAVNLRYKIFAPTLVRVS